jgi:hypothetical protein
LSTSLSMIQWTNNRAIWIVEVYKEWRRRALLCIWYVLYVQC